MIEKLKSFSRTDFEYYFFIGLNKLFGVLKWITILFPFIISLVQIFTPLLPATYPSTGAPKGGVGAFLALMLTVAFCETIPVICYGVFKLKEGFDSRVKKLKREKEYENKI